MSFMASMKGLCSEVVHLCLNLGELSSTERLVVFHNVDVSQPVNVAYFFSETHDLYNLRGTLDTLS